MSKARLYTSLTPAQRARYARVRPKAIELYRGGMNAERVAARFNVGQGIVLKWAREEGILRGRGGRPLKAKTKALGLRDGIKILHKRRAMRISSFEVTPEPTTEPNAPNGSIKDLVAEVIGEDLRDRVRSIVRDQLRDAVQAVVRDTLEELS